MNVCSYCGGVAGCHAWCVAFLVCFVVGVDCYAGLTRDEIESIYLFLYPEEAT